MSVNLDTSLGFQDSHFSVRWARREKEVARIHPIDVFFTSDSANFVPAFGIF